MIIERRVGSEVKSELYEELKVRIYISLSRGEKKKQYLIHSQTFQKQFDKIWLLISNFCQVYTHMYMYTCVNNNYAVRKILTVIKL